MGMQAEIVDLVRAINEEAPAAHIHLRDEELAELETLLRGHPKIWPVGLVDTFRLLKRRLCWETIDRRAVPEPLMDFFDAKFSRDLDPMAMARAIGCELAAGCDACGCRC
ncbi:MAG TPA: hypothetical protein PKM35_09185 [Holophaga sp.]|nr:hypothetical protein [Holophaga sp.]HPS66908.1 hypothetical protein [Holophaga sp.]